MDKEREVLAKLDLLAGNMLAIETMLVNLWTLQLMQQPPTPKQLGKMRERTIGAFEQSVYDGRPLPERGDAVGQAGIDRIERIWAQIVRQLPPHLRPAQPGDVG